MNQLHQQPFEQHITILGWLHIVGNLFFLILGILVFLLLRGIGAVSGDTQAVVILSLGATFVGAVVTLLSLPGIVAGFGLLAHKAWARYLAIGLGLLNLLNVPVGTLLGAYTLWVLMQEQAVAYFVQIPAADPASGMQG
jgi:hypothetical protein